MLRHTLGMRQLRTPSPDRGRARPRSELPAWYYRVTALTIDEDREVYPEDFDADLSGIDEVDETASGIATR